VLALTSVTMPSTSRPKTEKRRRDVAAFMAKGMRIGN
jgi:hypothetical protein